MTVEIVALSVALGLGMEPRRLMVLTLALLAPLAGLAALGLLLWRSRARRDNRAALFCEGVASELRSGAPLRQALAAAAASVGDAVHTPALTRTSLSEVAEHVAHEFPDIGPELELTIKSAATAGASTADLFDEIGSLAIAREEIANEVRIASAPARATALLFIAAPLTYVLIQAQTGGLGRLLAVPGQRIPTIIGLALFLGGLLAVSLVLRRSA